MGEIIWLASYPRSGNTWFRIFLANLLHPEQAPVSINHLPERNTIASCREIFDDITSLSASDLTVAEIELLRPQVHEIVAKEADGRVFLKVHDAYTFLEDQTPLLGSALTAKAIYLVRNPLDVAVSVAHHRGQTINQAIESMSSNNRRLSFRQHQLSHQLPQRLLTWSAHVLSWIDQNDLDVHLVRYEDLLSSPVETFKAAMDFAGIECSEQSIKTAIQHASFKNLQTQERNDGFTERLPMTKVFFRNGCAEDWRNHLDQEQIEKIIGDHVDVMERLGYLEQSADHEWNGNLRYSSC